MIDELSDEVYFPLGCCKDEGGATVLSQENNLSKKVRDGSNVPTTRKTFLYVAMIFHICDLINSERAEKKNSEFIKHKLSYIISYIISSSKFSDEKTVYYLYLLLLCNFIILAFLINLRKQFRTIHAHCTYLISIVDLYSLVFEEALQSGEIIICDIARE